MSAILCNQIEFVDIAGIVKGASEGAGLGNKFLMNIRMTDAIVHVVRCFVDDDIIHVDGNVDPLRDVEVISLELILADLSQIEKRLERVSTIDHYLILLSFISLFTCQFSCLTRMLSIITIFCTLLILIFLTSTFIFIFIFILIFIFKLDFYFYLCK